MNYGEPTDKGDPNGKEKTLVAYGLWIVIIISFFFSFNLFILKLCIKFWQNYRMLNFL